MHGASRSSTSLPPRLVPPIARVRPLPHFVPIAALAPARRPSEDDEESPASDVSYYSINSADESSPASSAPPSPPRHLASADVSGDAASAFGSAAAFGPQDASPAPDRFASTRPHPDAVRVRLVRPRCAQQVIV